MLQKLYLAQGALGQDLLAKNIGDLLDRDTFVCLIVHRCAVTGNIPDKSTDSPEVVIDLRIRRAVAPNLPNDTVGTLTQFLGNGVTFIDNEVLVENLEDFPAL